MVKIGFYRSQLLNVLMYISIYRIVISDGVLRVPGIAAVVDPFYYSLVVTVDLYSSLCVSHKGV